MADETLTTLEGLRLGLYHAKRSLQMFGGDAPVPDGLDPTFYQTLSADGDRAEIAEMKKHIAALEAAIARQLQKNETGETAASPTWMSQRIAQLEQEKTKTIAWANRSLDSVKEHMWAMEDALKSLNAALDAAWNDGSLSAIPEHHRHKITKAQVACSALVQPGDK